MIDKKRFESILEKFKSLEPIMVIGDVGLDRYTYGDVQRISPEAPVPVLKVKKEWEKLGLAANISHNLKTLGVESILCGVLGNDDKAKQFEHLLEEIELKIWGLIRDSSRPTIFKQRVTTDTQQICRVDYEEDRFIDEEILSQLKERTDQLSENSKALIVEDYSKGILSQELLRYLIDKHSSEGRLVAVDPGKQTPPLWYKGAGLLKPNLFEAKMMVEALGYPRYQENLEEIGTILLDKLKLNKLVITLGREGMALLEATGDSKLIRIPTVADEVYDVSGAGDTAIGLLTISLMSGATLEEAAWISNCGAGVVVAKKGTAIVSIQELTDFYYCLADSYKG